MTLEIFAVRDRRADEGQALPASLRRFRAGTGARSSLGIENGALSRTSLFGPLDAAHWQALAAMHPGIHQARFEAISKGLPSA